MHAALSIFHLPEFSHMTYHDTLTAREGEKFSRIFCGWGKGAKQQPQTVSVTGSVEGSFTESRLLSPVLR